ncbi:MAG TPA: sugar phosphate isomerase/epimerase family protein [Chthonomonadaceae bacterium]|nr:sugar phosphate isomerase/epimerase family protein [Chthonomonadaceae bacterium]
MYKALAPYAIHVRVNNLQESIEAARIGGFQGVEFGPNEIADLIDQRGVEAVKQIFSSAGVRPAGWGLPVEWRTSEETWRQGLEKLPRQAKAAAAIGGTRCYTWVMPCSNERDLEENRRFHIERFRPIAQILAENGCSLGLEFIGPKTLRESQKYPFIYKMEDMLAMGREIGPNTGVLLDCWHWYTSHGTLDAIRALRPEQVVYVHVNDAPAGISVDAQIDNMRSLPGETGVIDITGFLQALQAIGYDGPITPEPFKDELKDLPSDEDRLRLVGQAMDKIFRQAGITPA